MTGTLRGVSNKHCLLSFFSFWSNLFVPCQKKILSSLRCKLTHEPRYEKTCLRGFRPGRTQTGLYNHRRWPEA